MTPTMKKHLKLFILWKSILRKENECNTSQFRRQNDYEDTYCSPQQNHVLFFKIPAVSSGRVQNCVISTVREQKPDDVLYQTV